ncbi:MAG: M24 family metallopeptidase, partial [Erysipelotrichaceae bacterium]|nr:M24 family metallopeptidase [Erysipelotrichaceae bacterium]
NDTVCEENSLILFDLGAKWDYYCADVSRTYPVSGKFTERQKQLYNVVLKGLEVAESLSKPGQKKNELQQISKQVMAEELVKMGKIEKVEEIDKYYFHGSGHYIGLNTHDVGDERDVVLEENTMFTLEPGLYFDDEKIGIRIEDTLLVTKDGCEILSGGIPKTVEEIETYMAEHNKNVH